MRNIIGILIVFLGWDVMACDGCNVYTPTGFNTSQHRIGLFARQRTTFGEFSQLGEMVTKHSGHANDQAIWGAKVLEHYQTYELRGDFFIKENWQISAIIPVTNNRQLLNDVARFSIAGLSDPTVLAGYNFIRENAAGVKQRLGLGGGVKFPLGFVSLQVNGRTPNLDFQPGTGAYSGMAYVNYFITNSKWSGFVSVNYKKNGFNQVHYQYGQTLNVKGDAFWQTNIGKNTLMLQLGAYTELADYDQSTIVHKDTGGLITFGTVGSRILLKKFIIQTEFQPVIAQRLYGTTQLLTKNRINLGLTYVL
ncbi:MAG: hypothetical protein R3279_04790 [Putridiphycobacter sp.]|nr:hypothetical protein [Putridiphycobacter sp.]